MTYYNTPLLKLPFWDQEETLVLGHHFHEGLQAVQHCTSHSPNGELHRALQYMKLLSRIYLRWFIYCWDNGLNAEGNVSVLLVLTNQIANSLLPRATPSLNKMINNDTVVKHYIINMAVGLGRKGERKRDVSQPRQSSLDVPVDIPVLLDRVH